MSKRAWITVACIVIGGCALFRSDTRVRAYETGNEPTAEKALAKSSMEKGLYAVSRFSPEPNEDFVHNKFAWQPETKMYIGYSARDALGRALSAEFVFYNTMRAVLGMRCPAPRPMIRLRPLKQELGI